MSFSALFLQLVVVFVLVFIGYIGRKSKTLPAGSGPFLANLLMKFALPATLLSVATYEIPKVEAIEVFKIVALWVGYYIIGIAAFEIICRILKLTKNNSVMIITAALFGNFGFFSLPIAQDLFGVEGILYSIIAMALLNIFFFTYGISLFSDNVLKKPKLLITPSNIANITSITLLILGIRLPLIISKPIIALSGLTTPLAMMVIGVALAETDLLKIFTSRQLWIMSVLRVIVVPFIFVCVAKNLGLTDIQLITTTIVVGAPCGTFAAIWAQKHNVLPDVAAAATLHSTAICMFTIPALVYLALL